MRRAWAVGLAMWFGGGVAFAENASVGTTNVTTAAICGVSVRIDAVESRIISKGKVGYFIGLEIVELGPESAVLLPEEDAPYIFDAIKQAIAFDSNSMKSDKINWINEIGGVGVVLKSNKSSSPIIYLSFNNKISRLCNEESMNDFIFHIKSALSKISELKS